MSPLRAAPKKVLIAHQSAIPHYRVAFYEAVQRLKPDDWSFAVVHDPDPERRGRIFAEPIDEDRFGFPTERVRTIALSRHRNLRYQTFFLRARRYDLLVLEDVFHNLSYPLARLHRAAGVRVAYWGHGRDRSVPAPRGLKAVFERSKLRWARKAAGYFAYTEGVRDYLVSEGVDARKIFVLGNTVDIQEHRRRYLESRGARESLRRRRGWANRRVLLHVGRLTRLKRLDILAEALRILRQGDPSYLLAVVGTGDEKTIESLAGSLGREGFEYLGVATAPSELAPIYAASDAYVLPGLVGLGPLMALCYDLTPVIIESPTHSPEVEYLTSSNAVIAPEGASPEVYAAHIAALLDNDVERRRLRDAAWPSIRHLTIENMALGFIGGIDRIFGDR